MNRLFIDGNNVIGKSKELFALQKKNPQSARERLIFLIENDLKLCKQKIEIFFDGFPQQLISRIIKIHYSKNRTADELIKKEVEKANNRKLITIVSSDLELTNFARKCSCNVISSLDFLISITKSEFIPEKPTTNSINTKEWEEIFLRKK